MAPERFAVTIDGHDLELSNLDKLMYPAAGFTKGEVIDYYTRIAPVLLPHLADRAVTRIRFPNGVDGAHMPRETREAKAGRRKNFDLMAERAEAARNLPRGEPRAFGE